MPILSIMEGRGPPDWPFLECFDRGKREKKAAGKKSQDHLGYFCSMLLAQFWEFLRTQLNISES